MTTNPYEPPAQPEQYHNIAGWTPEQINQARRAGHLTDLLAGRPAPEPTKETNE